MTSRIYYSLIAVVVLFLISRFLILNTQIIYSDMFYYSHIGKQSAMASEFDGSVYDLRSMEYPPFAAYILNFPNFFISQEDLSNSNNYAILYSKYYRYLMFFFDLALFLLVILTNYKFYKFESSKWIISCLLYIICGHIMLNLIYDRLDIVLAFLIFSCYYLQIAGKKFWSGVFLSAGIFFKLIPIILIPVWLLAWLPLELFTRRDFLKNIDFKILLRPLLYLFVTFIIFLIFSLIEYGTGIFTFLKMHETRGIQIESIYSTLIQIFHWFGLSYYLETSFGSQNIVASISPFFSKISPFLILIGMFYTLFRITYKGRIDIIDKKGSIANGNPYLLGICYLVSMMAILIFSKVLSTQYWLWIIPFVSILLPEKKPGLSLLWIFIFLLTTFIFPYLYKSDIISIGENGNGKPSVLGTTLLFFRNILLIVILFYTSKKHIPVGIEVKEFFKIKTWMEPFNYFTVIGMIIISSILLFLNFINWR